MTAEVAHPSVIGGGHVRIHDSGDFHSDPYTTAWLRIIRSAPEVTFYAYTKEVERFKRLVEPNSPANFRWLYSHGGQQDRLIEAADRVADVFPSYEVMAAQGYSSQNESDLQAIYNENPKVGIPYNNIPHLKKALAGRTFQEWQSATDTYRGSGMRRTGNFAIHAAGRVCECGLHSSGPPAPGCKRN